MEVTEDLLFCALFVRVALFEHNWHSSVFSVGIEYLSMNHTLMSRSSFMCRPKKTLHSVSSGMLRERIRVRAAADSACELAWMHRGLVGDSGRSVVQWSRSVECNYKWVFCGYWHEICEPAMPFVSVGVLNSVINAMFLQIGSYESR